VTSAGLRFTNESKCFIIYLFFAAGNEKPPGLITRRHTGIDTFQAETVRTSRFDKLPRLRDFCTGGGNATFILF
jgi:hypothetical protein